MSNLNTKDGVSYAEIRPQLKSGDLIFFHGGDGVSSLISRIEKKVCGRGDYTHVGMVILSTTFPVGHPYRLSNLSGKDTTTVPYVFESTESGPLSDGVYNVSGRSFLGVQLRRLDEVVEAYNASPNTKIAWGQLRSNDGTLNDCDLNGGYINLMDPSSVISKDRRASLSDRRASLSDRDQDLFHIYRKYDGVRYDLNLIDLLSSVYPKVRKLRTFRRKYCCCRSVENWLFCSELVARIYVDLGILPDIIVCDDIVPVDFLPPTNKIRPNLVNSLISKVIKFHRT